MNQFHSVSFRLWLVVTFILVAITAATALQTRDLVTTVPFEQSASAPDECVPGTAATTRSSRSIFAEAANPADVEFNCTSWQALAIRAAIATGVCVFAGLVLLGFFWIGAAGRRRQG